MMYKDKRGGAHHQGGTGGRSSITGHFNWSRLCLRAGTGAIFSFPGPQGQSCRYIGRVIAQPGGGAGPFPGH